MKARSAIKRRSLEEVKEALKRRPIISRIFWVARLWLAAAQWKTGRIWTAYERRRGTDNRDWRNGSYSSVLSSCSARRGAVAPTATILYPSVTLVGRSAAATSHTKSARLRSRFHSWNRRLAGELSRAKLRAAGKKRAHRISRRGAREKGQEESERRRRKGGIDPIKRPAPFPQETEATHTPERRSANRGRYLRAAPRAFQGPARLCRLARLAQGAATWRIPAFLQRLPVASPAIRGRPRARLHLLVRGALLRSERGESRAGHGRGATSLRGCGQPKLRSRPLARSVIGAPLPTAAPVLFPSRALQAIITFPGLALAPRLMFRISRKNVYRSLPARALLEHTTN